MRQNRSKTHKTYRSVQFFKSIIADVKEHGDPRRPPHAFGYIRVSKQEQVESGLSLEFQEQACREFVERKLASKGVVWGGLFADEAVSAFKKHLPKRPKGIAMLKAMRRGDHLVVLRSDRAFRRTLDAAQTWELLEKMGVTMHVTDMPWDPSTASGRAMMAMLVVFAEWESSIKSERIKAAFAIKRQRGERYAPKPAWGYEFFEEDGRIKVRVSKTELEVLRAARQYIDSHKFDGGTRRKHLRDCAAFLQMAWPDYRGRPWTASRVAHVLDNYSKLCKTFAANQGSAEDASKRLSENVTVVG
jgi:DNA invertase Pin-like site-specific DNA recombinase